MTTNWWTAHADSRTVSTGKTTPAKSATRDTTWWEEDALRTKANTFAMADSDIVDYLIFSGIKPIAINKKR